MSGEENLRLDPNYRDDLSLEDMVRIHINRTAMSKNNENANEYPNNVLTLRGLLPKSKRTPLESKPERYTSNKIVWKYDYYAGTKLGTPEVPVHGSPRKEIKPTIDYDKLFTLCLDGFEECGLTWHVESHTRHLGKRLFKKKQLQPDQLYTTLSGLKFKASSTNTGLNVLGLLVEEPTIKIIEWNGHLFLAGPGYSPIVLDYIQARTNADVGSIIGICGAPGDGKTYSGMTLAEILDKNFNPYLQMPFSREHFLWLLSEDTPMKKGQVIIIDEAHFTTGARTWHKEDQQEMVNHIASARNMGFVIIIVALHLDMLDKILRQFVMCVYIHMERAGYGIAYKTFTPRFGKEMIKPRLGPISLLLPELDKCEKLSCLKCKSLSPKSQKTKECMGMRAIYERRKTAFQNELARLALLRQKEKDKLASTPRNSKIAEELVPLFSFYDQGNDQYTAKGRLRVELIIAQVQELYGIEIGDNKARAIRGIMEIKESGFKRK